MTQGDYVSFNFYATILAVKWNEHLQSLNQHPFFRGGKAHSSFDFYKGCDHVPNMSYNVYRFISRLSFIPVRPSSGICRGIPATRTGEMT